MEDLQTRACEIRKQILLQVYSSQTGHLGGSLSAVEILNYLYFNKMNINKSNYMETNRDKFVLSKGHAAPVLYAVLAQKGIIDQKHLPKLRKLDSILQGHPDMRKTPGVDMSTGSLGQGVSVAVGMALANKLNGSTNQVYCLLGDGELQEGQVWEAAMFAASRKLDNLTLIIDNNNLQIDGTLDQINSPYPIDLKFEAFGFSTYTCDGHDYMSIAAGFESFAQEVDKPRVLIAKTIKGKGISFMENERQWHGKAPNQTQYAKALKELEEQYE